MIELDSLPEVSAADARLIDRLCDQFEAAWRAGNRPELRHYLVDVAGPARQALLRQLLLLDLEYARRAGESPQAGDYQTRLPDDTALIAAVCREVQETSEPTLAKADPGARYELKEEVGQGGIGLVYRAWDRVLGRDLAVKILRAEYRDRPDARARFAAEARVGSRLQHPGIVPVYELGEFADGRPHLAMKLVVGQTLAAILREPTGARPDARLLAVFEQVSQAVAYAHSQGVVHRDLKPANVMIGSFGEVQVMDWGFAKQLGAPETAGAGTSATIAGTADETTAGTLCGTPAYMPPEQARGEGTSAGPRADVFALGAILCEILTGQPPYGAGTGDEVRARAASGDLSAALAGLDGCGADQELRDLARQCLAADPSNRPANAGVVATKMSAHLASVRERLQKAEVERAAATAKARTERRARRVILASAVAILIGAGLACWQAVVAMRAKRNAVSAAGAQQKARETADAREAETRAVFDFVQLHILSAAKPKGQDGGLGSAITLREALVASLPAIETTFAQQPLTEARVRTAVGNSFYLLGDAQLALEQFERARTIYEAKLGPDARATLNAMGLIANSIEAKGQLRQAAQLREQTLARQRAVLGSDDFDTAATMNNLGANYFVLRQFDKALALLEEAREIRRALLGADDRYTLGTMSNLVMVYAAKGRTREALDLCQWTWERQKAKLGPTNPETLGSMTNLANCYDDLKQYEEALAIREQALPLLKEVYPNDHPQVLWGMHNLANSYSKVGQLDDALRLHQATRQRRETKLSTNHPDTLRSLRAIAEVLVKMDKSADAIPIVDECVRRSAGEEVYPRLIPAVMDLRLRHFEKAADGAGCRATAEMWERLKRTDAESLLRAARFRAVTAKVVRQAGGNANSASMAAAETERAVEWLKRAITAGASKAQIDGDLDLAPIFREHPDF
jgi:tetratricopeptide (TPR) repeat protein